MQQSAPYAQPYEKPNGNGQMAYSGKPDAQYFAPTRPKFNDLWAAVLFYANIAAFIAVAVISLRAYAQTNGNRGAAGLGTKGQSITFDRSAAYLFSIVSGAGLVFSILALMIVRAFTKIILEVRRATRAR